MNNCRKSGNKIVSFCTGGTAANTLRGTGVCRAASLPRKTCCTTFIPFDFIKGGGYCFMMTGKIRLPSVSSIRDGPGIVTCLR